MKEYTDYTVKYDKEKSEINAKPSPLKQSPSLKKEASPKSQKSPTGNAKPILNTSSTSPKKELNFNNLSLVMDHLKKINMS